MIQTGAGVLSTSRTCVVLYAVQVHCQTNTNNTETCELRYRAVTCNRYKSAIKHPVWHFPAVKMPPQIAKSVQISTIHIAQMVTECIIIYLILKKNVLQKTAELYCAPFNTKL